MMCQDNTVVGLVNRSHLKGGKEGYLFTKFGRL